MRGEYTHHDFKVTIDLSHPGSLLELVKDIVAFANSGGGTLEVGATETSTPGVADNLAKQLDSARLMDKVNRFVAPGKVRIGHTVSVLSDGQCVVKLSVEGRGKYPYVFCKDGQFTEGDRTYNVFREGDIYIRRGSQTVRVSHDDIVRMIDEAEERGRRQFLDYLRELTERMVRLPEGSTPIVLAATPTGEIMGSPSALVDVVMYRRRAGDTSAVLTPRQLLEVFLERDQLELTPERREVLIRSALRRTTTLYFWLLGVTVREYVEKILLDTLDDQDRDKSDANRAILELASLYASDDVLNAILHRMKDSEYAHFRRAAAAWRGRDEELIAFEKQVHSVRIDGVPSAELSDQHLHTVANELARRIVAGENPRANADLLRNIGRLLVYQELRSRESFWTRQRSSSFNSPLKTPSRHGPGEASTGA